MYIKEPDWRWNSGLKNRSATREVIIHHSDSAPETTAESIDAWHKANGWAGIGYHFVIQKDGLIVRGRPEQSVGAHSLDHNSASIGICLTGDFTISTPAPAQINSLETLVKYAVSKYGLGIKDVKRHRDVNATSCPGASFPWAEFKAGLEESGMQDWEKKLGAEALDALVVKGLVENPGQWKETLGEVTPQWLFWTMIKRLTEKKG
ncbi:MAG: peptidoglycan recognition protein family protein [Syntrophomonadaceae bacterium]|jgi:N-acetyl-anhydromuramyl-L-alanine amidase AmpD|nr:peptidoglycan recognition protein family protein [Syntrophomonadaceae bacterium]